jgi:hypothetical protein
MWGGIVSYRGSLTKIDQALQFKRLYRLKSTVQKLSNSIVQAIHDDTTAEQAAKDAVRLFPLKSEIRYLERALRDFGVGPDQKLYDEYKQQSDKLAAEYVQLAVRVKDQPYFERFNTAGIETARKTTTLKPFALPEGHAQRGDGPEFVIWLPAGSTPEIDLSDEKGTLKVFVVDENTGELRAQRETIMCGGKAYLPIPDRDGGSLYWLRPVAEPGELEPAKGDSQSLTWKDLFGQEPPENYPTDALSLIEALNNSRGEWVFAAKTKRDDTEANCEANMEIQGGVQKLLRQDSFPQWQVAIAWPREAPTDRMVFNIMALPEPTGIKWMLAPQYAANDGKPIRGKIPMYEGAWNAETATITWTSKQMRGPLKKDTPAYEPVAPQLTFQVVIKPNGEIRISGYEHNDSLSFSGQSAARVGEPYVEKGPAIPKLPGGYQIFFASRLEVYLEAPGRYEGAGPRVEKIGCEGKYIFGLISTYQNKSKPSDTTGYFWVDSESGEITKGLELAAWRDALKSKGVNEPRLFGPEEVGE